MLNPDRVYSLAKTKPHDYDPKEITWNSLTELADIFKTDKGLIKHNYTSIYEKYINKNISSLLEIGVACGASLKMWANYLPHAAITGLDIRPECKTVCGNYAQIKIVIDDANTWKTDESFDVIIDDGSHVSSDIVRTFKNLWGNLKHNGIYVIEDMKCTHDPTYAKAFEMQKSPEEFKRKHIMLWLDELMRRMDVKQSEIEFIHYYREMMVIKKNA